MRQVGVHQSTSEEQSILEVSIIYAYNQGLEDAAQACESIAEEFLHAVSNESLALTMSSIFKEMVATIRELS